jgi:hypothetical protein
MPDSKITDLTSLVTPSDNDVFPIVDVLNDTTKKITVSTLGSFFNTAVNSNSGNWNSVYTNVNSNSGNWVPGGTGSQLQYKNGNAFAGIPNTSVAGNNVTIGGLFTALEFTGSSAGNGIQKTNIFCFGNTTWGNRLRADQTLIWSTDNTNLFTNAGGSYNNGIGLYIRRRGNDNLCLGTGDQSVPKAQTISVQSAAGTNIAGTLFTIDGSQSTGTALGGDIRFRTTKSSIISSSTVNSLDEVFRIKANGAVNFTPIAVDPTGNSTGDVYYNSTFNSLELFNGTAFVPLNTTRTIATFTALENHPVSANFAILNTRNFDNIGVLQFAAGATIRDARFISVIPDNAVLANGLLISIQFCTITATSGSCRWGAQIKKLSSTSYAASAGVDVTVSGTANQTTMTGTIALPLIDSLAPGDAYALRIFRESSDVADTLADSAQLLTAAVRTNI